MAQDRGRLEARIEVLEAELETLKKKNERDGDALKIKAKIVDDQTESIRKLKEVANRLANHLSQVSDMIISGRFLSTSGSPLLSKALQERDEQVRRIREEASQAQRKFQQQREEDRARLAEAREQLERLSLRKEELKQQLVDKDVELEETKRVHRQVYYQRVKQTTGF